MPATGPRTPEGKKVSSKNAIRHGLFAAELLITNEKPEELEQFRNDFWAVLQPVGRVEEELTDEIDSLNWRLKGLRHCETELLTHYVWSERSSGDGLITCVGHEREQAVGWARTGIVAATMGA